MSTCLNEATISNEILEADITADEVSNAIKNLKYNKCLGADCLINDLLKCSSNAILFVFSNLNKHDGPTGRTIYVTYF